MTLRGRLERAERQINDRPDRWAAYGGHAARYMATWAAVEADCRHYRWYLDDPEPDGPLAVQADGVIRERWPKLSAWLESVDVRAVEAPLGDAPPEVLAEAEAIRAMYPKGVGDFEGAERLVVAWAQYASSFAIILTRGAGCRFEHPAYAKNG